MSNLFYKNDFTKYGASPDPFILYDDGWFYMYYTGGRTLTALKSNDLSTWQDVGTVFTPDPQSWVKKCLWAPEVIKMNGKYYMYLTASPTEQRYFPEGTTIDGANNTIKYKDFADGVNIVVLTADSPCGPFVQWTGNRQNNKTYDHGKLIKTGDSVTLQTYPMFDFANSPKGWEDNKNTFLLKNTNIFSTIDSNPFVDSDGTLYMYFVRSHDSTGLAEHTIWGVRMLDPVTPEWDSMVKLTSPMKLTPNGESSPNNFMDGKLNEGPYVAKRGDIYYMTYCGGDGYNTALATSKSPLGTFTKLNPKYNNPILRVSPEFGFYNCPEGWGVFGAGHGMILNLQNENYFVYLTTRPKNDGSNLTYRTASIDRLTWVYNEELGYELPFINGPTYNTLQLTPRCYSGYYDIANKSTVEATNGKNANLLIDGIIPIHKRDDDHTFFTFDNSGTTITLTYDKKVTVTAIMVYNSRLAQFAFSQVDEIKLENGNDCVTLNNIKFSSEYLIGDPNKQRVNDSYEFGKATEWENNELKDGGLLPASSVIATLDKEVAVTKITIKISKNLSKLANCIGISGVAVIGKIK